MTVLDKFKPKPPHEGQTRMPRGAALQLPQESVPMRPTHLGDYADEAKRAAQRYLDQVAEIEALKDESDRWRHQCMVRDAQIAQLNEALATLEHELDRHKHTLAVIRTHYDIAGKILLDGLTAMTQLGGTQQRAEINMSALAAAVDKDTGDPVDPVPAKAIGEGDHDEA